MLLPEVTEKSFWALKASDVLELLETTSEGITEDDAKGRLELFGRNKIAEAKKATKLAIFLGQFSNPLIFLLLVAGTITLMLGDIHDAVAILVAALVNTILGFYQENKAEEALTHLRSYVEERIRIIRQSREFEISAENLVPGDIIRIAQGDRVPADSRLIYINDLMVDETILTGEALPVVKSLEPVGFHAPIGDQKSMVFSGTTVMQGFANAVVCRTGKDTEIGRIAELVRDRTEEQTPLQKTITNFSVKATLILTLLTSCIFLIGIFSGYSILAMFLTSVAILVAAVPEGLPVAMTVILAIGVQRLAKKQVITRKLLAVETLGSTTVILTDKTGTLTEAKLDLSKISLFHPSGGEAATEDFIMRLAALSCDVIIENPRDPADAWHIIGRPLERAVVKAAGKRGIIPGALKKQMRVLNYLPFNSANKFSASFFEYENSRYVSLFGAPEILLKLCTETPEAYRKEIAHEIDRMAYNGERVLGIAVRKISAQEEAELMHAFGKHKFTGFELLATISFTDPIRPGVRDTIHRIEHAGIKTVIVTGDHRGTAEAVAKELGFAIKPENVINGADLDSMTDEALRAKLPNLRIVSRVSPEGKVKIVQAYQSAGAIVAMTGDGVNDAPSMKTADIGIAMGSGSDVAKDIAELILLDDNYHTIVAAINEGRRTLENIRKVIIYLLSSLFDELFLIGGSLLFGFALPLNAIQILWVNFFTDSFPAIALGFENGIDQLLREENPRDAQLLNRETRFLLFVIGIPSSAMLFTLYAMLLRAGFDPAIVRSFIFASFGTYSLFLVFAVRSLHHNIFRYNPLSNKPLVFGTATGFIFTMAGIYFMPLQNLLHTTALPAGWLAGVIGVGIANTLLIELGKWWVHRAAPQNPS